MVPRWAFHSYDLHKPSIWPPLTDVVRRWLVECTMIESESNVQMNVICLIWLQLAFLIIHERAPLVILKVVFSFSFFSLWIHGLRLCCYASGLWARHACHTSGFSRGMLIYMWRSDWLKPGSQEPSWRCCVYISQLWQIQANSFYSTVQLYCLCAAKCAFSASNLEIKFIIASPQHFK